MNETINKATGETIKYNRIGGTADNPIYFNDPSTQPSSTSLTPTPVAPPNITASSLQPTTPVTVPTPVTTSPASTIISDITTGATSDIAKAQAEYEALQKATGGKAQAQSSAMYKAIQDLFTKKGEATAGKATLEEQAGINKEQTALNDIDTRIADQNVQIRQEVDRLKALPMSDAQRNVELNNIQDTYGRRLADLAILKSAAQGNIERIQQDADRKTKLLLAPIENALTYYKDFGLANIENLSNKEKNQLTFLQNNLEKQKEAVKELENAKASAIMSIAGEGGGKNLALNSAINSAKSLTEIAKLTAGSGYVGLTDRLYKQAQTSKLNAEAAKDKAAGLVNAKMANLQVGSPEYNKALILNSSKNKDGLAQDQRQKIAQSKQALSGLETLNKLAEGKNVANSDTKALFGEGTGIIQGRLRTLASQLGGDTNAATINATIQGLIPTVARGIYGEVGVLTDADIANYKKTVGGINTPEDANRAVRYLLTDTLEKTYSNTIIDAARNQQNVSGFVDDYDSIISRTNKLKSELSQPSVKVDANINPFGTVVEQFTSNIYDPNKGFIIPNK